MRKGSGSNSAGGCVLACFGWRALRHRQAVGAWRGLTPTPEASGTTASERGMATAGHLHSRAMALELAWGWLRLQPESALTQGYQQRWGYGRSRLRRIGSVAVARTWLIALWRLVETGVLPDGAALQGAVRLSPSRRSRCAAGLG
jgi:transposase